MQAYASLATHSLAILACTLSSVLGRAGGGGARVCVGVVQTQRPPGERPGEEGAAALGGGCAGGSGCHSLVSSEAPRAQNFRYTD